MNVKNLTGMRDKVLIVVTTYNKVGMTRKCMEYLQEFDHDIMVIDDHSTDGTPYYLTQIKVECMVKNERRGLTDSWNWAYKYFKVSNYSHAILMNNDVLVPKGTIEGMLSYYPLVVPSCNYDGAGYACKYQGIDNLTEQNLQLIQDNNPKKFSGVKEWTGFCMCFSRGIFEYELPDGNLFKPENINVGNDDDLARRVKAYVALGSFVYHFKGVSFDGKITGRNKI